MRRALARRLRDLADRVSPHTGPRGFPGYFTMELGVGLVVHQTDGILIRPPAPGCPLWFMEEDYYRAFLDSPVNET